MKLITSLPTESVIFSGLLREKNLLPVDLREQVQVKTTRAEKNELFLVKVIEPSLAIGDNKPLNDLFTVMSDEEYVNNNALKRLATEIKEKLNEDILD